MGRFSLGLAALALLTLTACQPVASPLAGIIFNDTKYGTFATTNSAATKQGKACATTILGWVATGDATVEAAKAAGGVVNIAYIDHTAKSILGIWGEWCTVVHGN